MSGLVAFLIAVLLILGGVGWVMFWGTRPSGISAAGDVDVFDKIPSFGSPIRVVYGEAMFEEPLRCAGTYCDHRLLLDGEEFFQIPVLNHGSNSVIAVCLSCSEHSSPLSKELADG